MDLVVPKRKVPARIRLADSTILDGFLYAALEGRRGTPETVADRLNDSTEKYLPFALKDRHLLLNKARIVTVRTVSTERRNEESSIAETGERREFRLKLTLSDGTIVVGSAHAPMPDDHARPLDYLNNRAPRFIDLVIDEEVFLVNSDYVVAVTEEPLFDKGAGPWPVTVARDLITGT